MQAAHIEFIDKYLCGDLTLQDEVPVYNPYPSEPVNPEAEQIDVIQSIIQRTRSAMQQR